MAEPGTATPVSGVCVQVLKPTGQVVGLYNAGYATSGPDGSYAVSHLPPGQSYVVQFNYASYCGFGGSQYGSRVL